ncbi:ISSpo9, transposase [Sagittula stellata E-37]|uniref:ISSpo9, transposase n=1 Tax=Sagittula stellata (strain ATCC 700073 / DSM 11524 / E-37) TaxID=388399 RepID=A3JY69_SAGS3|nr:ISSpo9, transposase [Sagittula stellata E-37]
MSRPPKPPCKTANWPAYDQALKRRGSMTVRFDHSMQWEAMPSGRRGRQQAYSDAAIQACLTHKVLLCLPIRQTTGVVASLLELCSLGWAVPDFSTLSRPLPDPLCQIPANEEIAKVTADGAYDTRACHDAIAARGAAAFGHSLGPMAFMPSLRPAGMPGP